MFNLFKKKISKDDFAVLMLDWHEQMTEFYVDNAEKYFSEIISDKKNCLVECMYLTLFNLVTVIQDNSLNSYILNRLYEIKFENHIDSKIFYKELNNRHSIYTDAWGLWSKNKYSTELGSIIIRAINGDINNNDLKVDLRNSIFAIHLFVSVNLETKSYIEHLKKSFNLSNIINNL